MAVGGEGRRKNRRRTTTRRAGVVCPFCRLDRALAECGQSKKQNENVKRHRIEA